MEAPAGKRPLSEVLTDLRNFIDTECERDGNQGFKHKKCGEPIKQVTLYVSIHDQMFGDSCAGDGQCKQFPLPYCPKCEGEPKNTVTCAHEPGFFA